VVEDNADVARPICSVVIPAHDEQIAIRRLLTALLERARPAELEILVICNGCSDATADVARTFGDDVTVIEEPRPSKREALRVGDARAQTFPRLYVDSDVRIGTDDARSLVRALDTPEVLAAAPSRRLQTEGVSVWVRAYYDVWEHLPQVRTGLFGRGVIAVSEAGFERIRSLPPVMSDDLAVSEAFAPGERTIVTDARVDIWLPRTLRGLIRRRIRVNTGTAQIDSIHGRPTEDQTTVRSLLQIMRRQPTITLRVPVFVGVAVVSKIGARLRTARGDYDTWLRDDSRNESA